MNPEILQILDRAAQNSLWVFLVSFVVLLIFARYRLKKRLKKVEDLFRREKRDKPEKPIERLPVNEWHLATRTLMISLFFAGAFFLVYVFTPLPFFDNFAAGDSWRITPLRVTAVAYDRFYQGFSLEGEVWNQTETPLLRLRSVVKVWGTDDKLLDEVVVPVEPAVLTGGTAGTFSLLYEENSPFIKGYQVSFVDQEGQPVPHVTGFDVE
jgi:hypothetical protein